MKIQLHTVPRSTVTLPSAPRALVTLPTVPRDKLDPGTFPPVRWHSFLRGDGYLSAALRILNPAVYTAEGTLRASVKSIAPAVLTASGKLNAPAGIPTPATFSATGTTSNTSRAVNTSKMFNADGSLNAVPVSRLNARWTAAAQLGLGVYEIEILMEPNFTAEGTTKLPANSTHPHDVGSEGSLSIPSKVATPETHTASGTLTAPTLNPVKAPLGTDGGLTTPTKVPHLTPITGAGSLLLPSRALHKPGYNGAGSLGAFVQLGASPAFGASGSLGFTVQARGVPVLDTWAQTSTGTSLNITTKANTTVVVFCVNNTVNDTYQMTIDSDVMTRMTTDTNNVFYFMGATAGTHTINVVGSMGAFRQLVAVSYENVSTVSGINKTAYGINTNPWSASPTGPAGSLMLGAFYPSIRPFTYSSTDGSFVGASVGVSGYNRTVGVFDKAASSISTTWGASQNGHTWGLWLS